MISRRTGLWISSVVALTSAIACVLNPQPLPPDTNDSGATAGGNGGHQNGGGGTSGSGATSGSGGTGGGGGDAGAVPAESGTDAFGSAGALPLPPDGATDVKAHDGATDAHSEGPSGDAPSDVKELEGGDATGGDAARGDAPTG